MQHPFHQFFVKEPVASALATLGQESLGGNAFCTMIATISASAFVGLGNVLGRAICLGKGWKRHGKDAFLTDRLIDSTRSCGGLLGGGDGELIDDSRRHREAHI